MPYSRVRLFQGVLISGVSLFQGRPYFRGVLILGVSLFQGAPISGCPYFRVSLFQGCPYFRGVLILGVFLFQGAPISGCRYFRGVLISGASLFQGVPTDDAFCLIMEMKFWTCALIAPNPSIIIFNIIHNITNNNKIN